MDDVNVKDLKTLVVDDEASLRKMLGKAFESMGVNVDEAEDGVFALEMMRNAGYDLVIADIKMPRMDGMSLLKKIREDYPDTDVMIMTSFATDYSYVDVVTAGAIDFIAKPFSLEELKAKVKRVARERALFQELKEANRELEDAYAEILMIKDDEEVRCRQINYEREKLLAEKEKLRRKIKTLGGH